MNDENGESSSGPWLRHALLWGAFAILVAIGIVTVMLPSLEDAPLDEDAAEGVDSDTSEAVDSPPT